MLEVGWWGVIKGSFQKHFKTGGGQRQKLFVGGGGVLKVSPTLKILIIHIMVFYILLNFSFPANLKARHEYTS